MTVLEYNICCSIYIYLDTWIMSGYNKQITSPDKETFSNNCTRLDHETNNNDSTRLYNKPREIAIEYDTALEWDRVLEWIEVSQWSISHPLTINNYIHLNIKKRSEFVILHKDYIHFSSNKSK